MRSARSDELTGRGVVHDYLIVYPSGQRIPVRGVFMFMFDGAKVCSPAVREGTRLVAFDPRAVVTRGDLIVYEPRQVVGLPAWVQDWLEAHPEWPPMATAAP
jgi:hypothetical protein